MTRQDLLQKISTLLRGRKLVWFGTRGEDVQSLLDVPQLTAVFSLIAPLGSVSLNIDDSLESITGVRVDLDSYDLDKDSSPQARELRRRLFTALSAPAVLVPYRPLAFLAAVQYPRATYVEYLGLFHERQAPFEHKPWVETELKKLGLPTLPWRYHTDDNLGKVTEHLASAGRLVLRTNRSDGGTGVVTVTTPDELSEIWQPQSDGFLASAPELRPHIPLNVSACVFANGEITLHPLSLQLLGIKNLTTRPYGYCGNDFSAVKHLESHHISQLESFTRRIGQWLASKGYLGAFGVDAMLYENKLYIVELNARFQGSSALSAELDRELNRPDVYLCHMASFLGLEVHQVPNTLEELTKKQADRAHLVYHNCARSSLRMVSSIKNQSGGTKLLPKPDVWVKPHAILFRKKIDSAVTTDGFSIDEELADTLCEYRRMSFPAATNSTAILRAKA